MVQSYRATQPRSVHAVIGRRRILVRWEQNTLSSHSPGRGGTNKGGFVTIPMLGLCKMISEDLARRALWEIANRTKRDDLLWPTTAKQNRFHS